MPPSTLSNFVLYLRRTFPCVICGCTEIACPHVYVENADGDLAAVCRKHGVYSL